MLNGRRATYVVLLAGLLGCVSAPTGNPGAGTGSESSDVAGGGGDAGSGTAAGMCTDTCDFAGDGECDDGRPGALYSACDLGTDCADCGPVAGGSTTDPDRDTDVVGSTFDGGTPPEPSVDGVMPLTGRRPGIYVANLVDASLERDLLSVLRTEPGASLARASRAFYQRYPDEFDFVYFVTPNYAPDVQAYGVHEAVTREAIPGTGAYPVSAASEYGSGGRLKAAIALAWVMGGWEDGNVIAMGPALHETGHYWGVYLDDSFGFGRMRGENHGPHWGATGTYGQLGGFNPAELRCANPAGTMPPCNPEASGRTRYQVGDFGPDANGGDGIPYSAMELYLMGLLPASEAPRALDVMVDAEVVAFDEASWISTVEVQSMRSVGLSDIIARHGARPPATQRDFRGAFVILSSTPAPAESVRLVEAWALAIGHVDKPEGWGLYTHSFHEATGGRATMDTWIAEAPR